MRLKITALFLSLLSFNKRKFNETHFRQSPSLGIRLLIAIFASIALILADGRNSSITKARSAMETAIGGLYYLANSPRSILDGISENLVDTNKLQIENKVLRQQLLEKTQIYFYLINSKLKISDYVFIKFSVKNR